MKPCPNCQKQPLSFPEFWRGANAVWVDCRHCGRPLKANKVTWFWLLACVTALIVFFILLFAGIADFGLAGRVLKPGLFAFIGACAILSWFTGGYQRDTFAEERLAPSPDKPACPSCGEPLRSATARQCFQCGADWHDSDSDFPSDNQQSGTA